FESPITWYTATVDQPGAWLSTWSFTQPEQLPENFYTILLQSSDTAGNQSNPGTIWRGLIDQVPPMVTAVGEHIGEGDEAQTEYTFTFSDFLLDGESFVHPCGEEALVSQVYADPLLPYDGLPYEVTATCTVPGHEGSRDFTACDAAGLCTTETVTLLLAPVAHEDTYTATEDVVLSEPAPGVLENDEERTGSGELTAVLDTPPQHGALTLNANGG